MDDNRLLSGLEQTVTTHNGASTCYAPCRPPPTRLEADLPEAQKSDPAVVNIPLAWAAFPIMRLYRAAPDVGEP